MIKQYSQIKEGKLTRIAAMFVHKSTSQVATEDRSEIVIRNLGHGQRVVRDDEQRQEDAQGSCYVDDSPVV